MNSREPAPAQRPRGIAFGDFVLDPVTRRLSRRDGQPVELAPRLFDALLFFVERPGELLDRDRLLQALWPGLVVEENNLSQLISALRRALGDDAQGSRYIQTVPRRGFRFIAAIEPVSTVAPAPPAAAVSSTVAAPSPGEPSTQVAPDHSRRRWLVVGGGILVAAAGALAWVFRPTRQETATGVPAALAVLPFKPLVSEQRDELLEIGMADSLIARLSTVPGLTVRSVGSVRRFAGPDQDPALAARELRADWIVDGSLQRWGDQLRVTARLLRATDGVAAWSGSFDEKFTSVFDVQDAISTRVAGVLAPRLQGSDAARTSAIGGSRNADAYQLYLAARAQAQSLRAQALRRSVELYRRAIEFDGDYALAYAGLAETYRRMVFGADAAPVEVLEPARVAANRALQIQPGLAEAHASLAWIRFWYEWDWPQAETQFRRAIELNPNVVEARFGLGLLLLSLDRSDEGLRQVQTARELDPLSLILNTLEAGFLLGRGRASEGEARLNRVLEIEPRFWVAHLTKAGFHRAAGRTTEAIDALYEADRLADESTQAAGLLGFELARVGRRDEAQAVLQRLRTVAKTRYVPPTSLAMIHAGLGETEVALAELERGLAVRDTRLVYMKDDHRWDALRQQPRFIALMQQLKLDRYGAGTPAN